MSTPFWKKLSKRLKKRFEKKKILRSWNGFCCIPSRSQYFYPKFYL
ncbi:hypothetical protein HMPREF0373_01895 [Eubacterium ramulus ATCC 29099]|uniref:Uncharacterized protein n=1 Tax=Eubacterium ramulus ATCC 29099 TaxID=1256908 RepID=U2P6I0_EUBRA|nr:hypothetical protein HMPREF0373_01895 [Eubacterium ramulus ATCC 29099]